MSMPVSDDSAANVNPDGPITVEQSMFVCTICLDTARNAVSTRDCCDNLFCEWCADAWARSPSGNGSCPACRHPFFDFSPNQPIRRILNKARIFKCLRDCGDVLRGDELADHDNVCGHAPVECPFRCGKDVMRVELGSHLHACPLAFKVIDDEEKAMVAECHFLPRDMRLAPIPEIPHEPNAFEMNDFWRGDVERRKRLIGDQLYYRIQRIHPRLAGKITGMIMEMDERELLDMMDSMGGLLEKVNEAIDALRQHDHYRILLEGNEVERRRLLGESLYYQIQRFQPRLAGKITGMLLEMDENELFVLVNSPDALLERVQEAVHVLGEQQAISMRPYE